MRRLLPVMLFFVVFVPSAGAWTWPVTGPVLQGFSFDPAHPYAGGQHRGVDIGASASGIDVVAPAAGTVTFAGSVPTSGKSLTIETTDGLSVTLTHLGSISVAKNAAVGEGDVVGTVGPSGTPDFDQPYLHLGVRTTVEPDGYLDPLGFLPLLAPPPTAQPAPAPTADPAPAPVTVPVVEPAPAPVDVQPAAEPAPAAAPDPEPAPAPVPAPAPAPEAPPAPAPAPVAVGPAPVEIPAPVVAPAIEPAVAPVPALASDDGPTLVPLAQPLAIPVALVATERPEPRVNLTTAVAVSAAPRRAPAAPVLRRPRVRAPRPRVVHAAPVAVAVARRPVAPPVAVAQPAHARPWTWLLGVLGLALTIALCAVRIIMSRFPSAEGAHPVEAVAAEDPRRGRVAVRERSAASGPRRRAGRAVRHLRPLPPLERQRRADGERDGRARDAGDGVRRPGGRVAA